jgi:segregation and condensation protein B
MNITDPNQPPQIHRPEAEAEPKPEPRAFPPPAERARAIQAMLFVSATPIKVTELQEATGWDTRMIERDLDRIQDMMAGQGIELQRVAGALRLVTASDAAPYVEKLLGVQTRRRLSRTQLEALAVVAYRQPATRAQVEAYRGVNCERVLGQLVDLSLIREIGRADLPGRPLIYGTTPDFLRYFSLESLDRLPDITALKPVRTASGVSASQALWNGDEEPQDNPDMKRYSTMQPLAAEIAPVQSSGLQKLFSRIRGKSPKP